MPRVTETIANFSHFLRQRGMAPGIQQTLDAVQAAAVVSVTDRATFKSALKTTLCSSKTEWDLFDHLFEEFWKRGGYKTTRTLEKNKPKAVENTSGPQMLSEVSDVETQSDEGHAVAGASLRDRLTKADFSEVSVTDMADLERLATLLLAKLSERLSRRFRQAERSGKRLDLRRTLRMSVSSGGVPLRVCYKTPRPRPLKLAILLDISGSMNAYSLFLLRFAYSLQKHFAQVGTFIFSTDIQEISESLKTQDLTHAFHKLDSRYAGWAGGTRIGESLRIFREEVGSRFLTRHTVVIILSDGWDTGEPELLGRQLAAIKAAVQRVIWLTPLLGTPDYQPLTRSLRAALPHIDIFAPAHNLESLLQLERHLYV